MLAGRARMTLSFFFFQISGTTIGIRARHLFTTTPDNAQYQVLIRAQTQMIVRIRLHGSP
ncbi:hypothetical protein WCQ02_21280 [Paraburkholderia tropica]|uniref:hypothetical protein n=1 Tax=Paraburkholderia tropica TaxID=92647 RepID=UPI00301AD664